MIIKSHPLNNKNDNYNQGDTGCSMEIKFEPIGIIHSPYTKLHDMPIQPSAARGVKGQVEVDEKYLTALSDLEGLSV